MVPLNNENEWTPLSELLSNLIAKYADDLDIDAMPDPDTALEEAHTIGSLKKNTKDTVVKENIA